MKRYLNDPEERDMPEGRGVTVFVMIVILITTVLVGLGIWKAVELIKLLPK